MLLETGGAEDLRHRHTAYFLELVELAKPELHAPGARRSGSTGSKRSMTTSVPCSATGSSTNAPTSHFGSATLSGSSG
jgi:hypothetical protein